MEKTVRKRSSGLKIAVLIVILIIAAVGVFAAWTYPRTVLGFPVSFTLGAQTESGEFNVPALHSLVQVQVIVSSGTALWEAKILSTILNFGNTAQLRVNKLLTTVDGCK